MKWLRSHKMHMFFTFSVDFNELITVQKCDVQQDIFYSLKETTQLSEIQWEFFKKST